MTQRDGSDIGGIRSFNLSLGGTGSGKPLSCLCVASQLFEHRPAPVQKIHPSAIIGNDAAIHDTAIIGAHVVIEGESRLERVP